MSTAARTRGDDLISSDSLSLGGGEKKESQLNHSGLWSKKNRLDKKLGVGRMNNYWENTLVEGRLVEGRLEVGACCGEERMRRRF